MERQGSLVARRRSLRGHKPDADCHCRNQSQHPASLDHRLMGDHDASALRRTFHARHRPRRGGDVRRVRGACRDDRADGGLRPGHASALERRGDLQPRRADGQVSGALSRSRLQGGHPAGSRGVRAEDARAGRPGVRRRHPSHLLHTGNPAALRQNCEGRGAEGRSRPGQCQGVVVFRNRRRSPTRRAAVEEDRRAARDLPPGLRRSAGQHQRLGSCCAATLPRRLGGDVDSWRDRSQGDAGADRAHRDVDSR